MTGLLNFIVHAPWAGMSHIRGFNSIAPKRFVRRGVGERSTSSIA